jgi:hypothetical protein
MAAAIIPADASMTYFFRMRCECRLTEIALNQLWLRVAHFADIQPCFRETRKEPFGPIHERFFPPHRLKWNLPDAFAVHQSGADYLSAALG